MFNFKAIIATVLMSLVSMSTHADYFWLEARAGGSNIGLNLGIQLNYAVKEHVYSIGFANPDTDLLFDNEGNVAYEEYYIVYGIHNYKKWYSTTMQAGISAMKKQVSSSCENIGLLRTECENESNSITVGIPLDFTVTLGKYAGLGLNLHLNINSLQPLAALSINYSIGKFN